jgi:hypothetical protein
MLSAMIRSRRGEDALRMRLYTGLCAVFVCLLCAANTYAQSESERAAEVFAGLTRSRSNVACCSGNATGFHLGVGYAPIRFLILQSEYSHAFGPDPQYIRHLHFGPQVRFQVSSLRPFARVMAGFSEHRTNCPDVTGILTRRGFSVAMGGGVDLFVHPRAAIRVISLDRIKGQDEWDTRASFGLLLRLF